MAKRPQNKNLARAKRPKFLKRKNGRPTGTTEIGAVERLDEKILRAWHLRSEGLYYHEIAIAIAKEFGEAPVTQKTIMTWLDKYKEEFFKEIKGFQERARMEQFMQLERMKRKFLPLACSDQLQVNRHVKDGKEMITIIDENAFEEQRKAAETVIKLMARQAQLMGIDLSKAMENGEGGGMSLQELQLYIIAKVMPAIHEPGTKLVPGREVLELESGHAGADAIEKVEDL